MIFYEHIPKMTDNTKTICVIGLGYVGLPLACLCASKGYTTYGLDIDKEVVEKTNTGISHIDDEWIKANLPKAQGKLIATTDPSIISKSDIVLICVPTPVDKSLQPDLNAVTSATEAISKHLKKEHIIILESTVFPGTTDEVVKPILEKSGLKAGTDFVLAHCPERIDPGNKKWNVSNIPRVVGTVNKQKTKLVAEFYRSIIDAEITELSSIKAAEATKIMENTFRDINIAFINEMAMSFDNLGIDITEVVKGASTKPFAFMPHYPGCGVGGHCIPVDPYYLIERAKAAGFTHNFLSLAREINNSMPKYTISRLVDALNAIGKSIRGTKITVLGVAYKGGVEDDRESPSYKIIDELKKLGADLIIFDPYITSKSTVKTLDQALDAEAIIIATNHPAFRQITPDILVKKGVKVFVDGKNMFDPAPIKQAGIEYRGIGRS
jgi:UDP-N-acetyl-D-glucosamine dehydrogenase